MGRPKTARHPKPEEIPAEEESQEAPDDEEGTSVLKMGSPRAEKPTESITKAEAIRRALAEGLTKHEDAAPFILTHFGHDVTPGHFAASKSREKPAEAAKEAPRRGRPPGKATKPAEVDTGTAPDKIVTKAEACRAALARGIETTEEAVSFVKSEFGIEIKPTDFSLYKSKEKAKQGEAPPEPAKPGRKPATPAATDVSKPVSTGKIPAGLFDDIRAMKEIKERYGDEFEALIGLLG